MNNEKVLVLFSGGLDSMLTACKLVEEGYHVILAHFNNGSSSYSSNSKLMADRLIERYGKDKIEFWGIGMTVGYFYALRTLYMNKSPQYLAKLYPNLYYYQVICLTCRTAMYIYAIRICQELGINYIAEGARKSQAFAIEQPSMLKRYQNLLNEYNIKLITPLLELESDITRDVLLMIREISPKVLEPSCMLGVPMKEPLTNEELDDTTKFYDDLILDTTRKLIKESEHIPIDNRGKMF